MLHHFVTMATNAIKRLSGLHLNPVRHEVMGKQGLSEVSQEVFQYCMPKFSTISRCMGRLGD